MAILYKAMRRDSSCKIHNTLQALKLLRLSKATEHLKSGIPHITGPSPLYYLPLFSFKQTPQKFYTLLNSMFYKNLLYWKGREI